VPADDGVVTNSDTAHASSFSSLAARVLAQSTDKILWESQNIRLSREFIVRRFFAHGLPARHAVTSEPKQAAWDTAKRPLSATQSSLIRLLVRWKSEWKPDRFAKLEERVSVQNSLLWLCYLQLTDTPGFRGSKLYRGFESFPLRQTVCTAEKFRRHFRQNLRVLPVFRDSCSPNRTAENGPRWKGLTLIRPFSLEPR